MNNIKILTFREKILLFIGLRINIKTKQFKKIINLKADLNKIENAGFNIHKNSKFLIITDNSGLNINFRKYSSDLDVFKQVFINEGYKKLLDYFFEKENNNKNYLNIIDAGANIGLFSIYIKDKIKIKKIVAIEPDEKNYYNAKINFEKNKIQNINLLKGVLWINNKPVSLKNDFRDGKEWSYSVNPKSTENNVSSYTFYDVFEILNNENIDILKIDIEGSEKYIFDDAAYANYFLGKTKFIAIEIHDEFNCRDTIYERLHKNNFEFFNDGELTIGHNKNLVY